MLSHLVVAETLSGVVQGNRQRDGSTASVSGRQGETEAPLGKFRKDKEVSFCDLLTRHIAIRCLFLLPSVYEGFGTPLNEASACGAPTAVSNIPVFEEFAGQRPLHRLLDVDAWPTATQDTIHGRSASIFDGDASTNVADSHGIEPPQPRWISAGCLSTAGKLRCVPWMALPTRFISPESRSSMMISWLYLILVCKRC